MMNDLANRTCPAVARFKPGRWEKRSAWTG
jgi:hypothetical protein